MLQHATFAERSLFETARATSAITAVIPWGAVEHQRRAIVENTNDHMNRERPEHEFLKETLSTIRAQARPRRSNFNRIVLATRMTTACGMRRSASGWTLLAQGRMSTESADSDLPKPTFG